MKSLAYASLLASTILTTSLLAACSTEDQVDEIEVTLETGDGKFDALNGRKIRFRNIDFEVPWIEDDAAQLGKLRTLSVDIATDDIALVSSTNVTFAGSVNEMIGDSPWRSGKILELSATPVSGSAQTIGFVLGYSTNRFHTPGTPFTQRVYCNRDGYTVNVFQKVAIDVLYREIHTADKTFTFAECGITTRDVEMNFDVSALPLTTSGSFTGTTKYRLSAVLK